ncbi:hypothetical protein RQP46_000265 [Phenoliferia psychrophenolica]
MVRNVVVLGGSYAGSRAAELLAKTLPSTHRVILVERQSSFRHLYLFPRHGVVPDHAHKAFIPYNNLFGSVAAPPTKTAAAASPVVEVIPDARQSLVVHASVVKIGEGFIEIDRDLAAHEETADDDALELADRLASVGLDDEGSSTSRRIPYDYLIYALGSTLPPPLISPARTKKDGVAFLKTQHDIIKRAKSILVVGGGALGIQYATDIADYYNSPHNAHHHCEATPKKVTLMHSRDRFLPLYSSAVDVEIKRRLAELKVDVILGERVPLPSTEELAKQEKSGEMHKIVTSKGQVVEFDLLLRCTGQVPNSKLLKDFLPDAVNKDGYVNVLPTLQVALPPSNRARDDIYAIGDVADMGVIKAGHTGWNAAGTAVQNIMCSIGVEGSLNNEQPTLTEFEITPPQIKVTLGLNHAVSELLPSMGAAKTEVKMISDGPVDGHWQGVWTRMGESPLDPHVGA